MLVFIGINKKYFLQISCSEACAEQAECHSFCYSDRNCTLYDDNSSSDDGKITLTEAFRVQNFFYNNSQIDQYFFQIARILDKDFVVDYFFGLFWQIIMKIRGSVILL